MTCSVRIEVRPKLTDGVMVHVSGRLNVYGAGEFAEAMARVLKPETTSVILELSGLEFISSAGIREILVLYKRLNRDHGLLVLCGLKGYSQEVMTLSGFTITIPTVETVTEALVLCRAKNGSAGTTEGQVRWGDCSTYQTSRGLYRYLQADAAAPSQLTVTGDIRDILHSRVQPMHMQRLALREQDVGFGDGLMILEQDAHDPIGQLAMCRSVMAWRAAGTSSMADSLHIVTPAHPLEVDCAFFVQLGGDAQVTVDFHSTEAGGTTMGELYRDLFELASRCRFNGGIIAITARAELGRVYGMTWKKEPTAENKPENGKTIIHESNIDQFFEDGSVVCHEDVSCAFAGVGADLTADLSDYPEDIFQRLFYLHPVNIGTRSELLMNTALIYEPYPMPPQPADVDESIRAMEQKGLFTDMRAVRDTTTVKDALIRLQCIEKFDMQPIIRNPVRRGEYDEDEAEHVKGKLSNYTRNQLRYYEND